MVNDHGQTVGEHTILGEVVQGQTIAVKVTGYPRIARTNRTRDGRDEKGRGATPRPSGRLLLLEYVSCAQFAVIWAKRRSNYDRLAKHGDAAAEAIVTRKVRI